MNTSPPVTSFVDRHMSVLTFVGTLVLFLWLAWVFDVLSYAWGAAMIFPPLLGLLPGVWWRRGPRPTSAYDHLTVRTPVWSALSEFYLDTELFKDDHQRIAGILVRSGYSVSQIEEILYREVHPALFLNLLSGAGEWAGFDTEWLADRILSRDRMGLGVALVPAKWMVSSSWRAVRALMEAR